MNRRKWFRMRDTKGRELMNTRLGGERMNAWNKTQEIKERKLGGEGMKKSQGKNLRFFFRCQKIDDI